jgi:hypothetical protein
MSYMGLDWRNYTGSQIKRRDREIYRRGDCQEFRVGRPVEHQAAMALVKRSPKRTAN